MHWRYLLILLAATALFVIAPIPSKRVAQVILKLVVRSGGTVILGPSTIDEHSRCDTDQRTVAQMLAAHLGSSVRDVSNGGQTPGESLSFAALALKMQTIQRVVIAVDTSYLSAEVKLSYGHSAFFRVVTPDLYADVPGSYFDKLKAYGGNVQHEPFFVYEGTNVPSYAVLAATWFPDEQRRMTCPENDGHDLALVKAVTYHEQVLPTFDKAKARMFQTLAAVAKADGKQVLVVILPVDNGLLGQFDPKWPDRARDRVQAFKTALAGLQVLNLSDTLPKEDFIDRWCGCVHLSDRSRQIMAKAIADRRRGF